MVSLTSSRFTSYTTYLNFKVILYNHFSLISISIAYLIQINLFNFPLVKFQIIYFIILTQIYFNFTKVKSLSSHIISSKLDNLYSSTSTWIFLYFKFVYHNKTLIFNLLLVANPSHRNSKMILMMLQSSLLLFPSNSSEFSALYSFKKFLLFINHIYKSLTYIISLFNFTYIRSF